MIQIIRRKDSSFHESFSDLMLIALVVFIVLVLILVLNVNSGVSHLKNKTKEIEIEKSLLVSDRAEAKILFDAAIVLKAKYYNKERMLAESTDELRDTVRTQSRLIDTLRDSAETASIDNDKALSDLNDKMVINNKLHQRDVSYCGTDICGMLVSNNGKLYYSPAPPSIVLEFVISRVNTDMNKLRKSVSRHYLNNIQWFTIPEMEAILRSIRYAYRLPKARPKCGNIGFGVHYDLTQLYLNDYADGKSSIPSSDLVIEVLDKFRYLEPRKRCRVGTLPTMYIDIKETEEYIWVGGVKLTPNRFSYLIKGMGGYGIRLECLKGGKFVAIPEWINDLI